MTDSRDTETIAQGSISIETLPGSRRKLIVQGTPADVKKTFTAALREVNKSVTIPGFRKGKAPEKLIQDQFPEAVQKAWKDETAQALLTKGLAEAKVTPLFNKVQKSHLPKLSKEEGAVLEVEFEVEPVSPAIDLTGFAFKSFETPEAESAEEALETLRTFHGEGVEVTDRAAEALDLVTLDIDLMGDHPMEVSRGKTFYLEPKRISPWLFAAIVGKELNVPFEALGEGVDGKIGGDGSRQFEITIRGIKKMIPHELDEPFWKKLGVTSQEQFIERFNKEHERQVLEFTQQQKRFQIAEFLKDKFPIEVPKGLVDYEAEIILRNTVLDFLRQGVTEEWVKGNANHLRKEAEKLAIDRLTTIYLTLNAAQNKKVTVLIAEMQKEKMIEEMVRPHKERILLAEMSDQEKENRLYFEIISQKTLDLLASEVEKSE